MLEGSQRKVRVIVGENAANHWVKIHHWTGFGVQKMSGNSKDCYFATMIDNENIIIDK